MNAPLRTVPTTISVDFTDYAGMVEAMRTIKAHLQLSNATIDRLCGWVEGQADKHLGPSCIRAFSPKNFNDALWVFAVKGTLTLDLDRVKEIEQHWEQRCASNTRERPNRISKVVMERAKPEILKQLGKAGGLKRASKLRPKLRSQIARAGGKARMLMAGKIERSKMSLKGWQTRRRRRQEIMLNDA